MVNIQWWGVWRQISYTVKDCGKLFKFLEGDLYHLPGFKLLISFDLIILLLVTNPTEILGQGYKDTGIIKVNHILYIILKNQNYLVINAYKIQWHN